MQAELRSELRDEVNAAVKSAVSLEVSTALSATRRETWRRLDELSESMEATKLTQRRMEVKAHERHASVGEEIDALWDQLREVSKSPKVCEPPGDSSVSTLSPRTSERSLSGVSAGSTPEHSSSPEPPSLGKEEAAEGRLRNHPLALLGERQRQQAQELSALRGAVIEVQTDLSLHCVRTSRLAMQAVELSQEERQEALATLASKERQLKADALIYQQRSNALQEVSEQEEERLDS
jgi:hypothetical protein